MVQDLFEKHYNSELGSGYLGIYPLNKVLALKVLTSMFANSK